MLRNPGLRKSVEQPVLDLNFAASQIGSNAAPDSRIAFSRGTNAWFVDSDGVFKKSPHNLALRSEDLTTGWNTFNGSVSANASASPSGEITADKFVIDNGATVSGPTRQVSGLDDSVDVAVSVYLKAAGATVVNVQFYDKANTFHGSGDYDLTNGTRTSNPTSGTESSIENVGNDWYRVTFTGLNTGTGGTLPNFRIVCNQTGDGSKGYLIWGGQLSQHTTLPVDNPYIKTEGSVVYAARLDHDPSWFMSAAQEQNLLQYSETIDDSYWTKVRTTVTANAIEAPDGTVTAELLSEDSSNGTHIVRNNTATDIPQTAGKSYVFSGYLKAGSRSRARVRFEQAAHQANINLAVGTITNVGFDSVSLSDEGNGWFRFVAVETADSREPLIQVMLLNDSSQTTYTGDGSSGLYVWGLQLEVGTASDTYHRTEGQIYLGPGATPKGLLVEEARTNIAPNSHQFTANTGLTRSGEAIFAPDAVNEGDAFTVSSGSSEAHQIGMNGMVGSAVTTGTVHAISFFAKLLNGTPNLGVRGFGKGGFNQHPIFNLSNGTVANVGSAWESGTKIEDFGNGWFRCSCVVNPSAQFAPIIHMLESGDNQGVLTYTGNGTDKVALWGGQVEIGSFPTSHIPTSGGTATRNADVATMGPTTGGTEIVTNGTFDTDVSNWVEFNANSSITYSSGTAIISSNQYNDVRQVLSLVEGRRYRASMDVITRTSGAWFFLLQHDSTNSHTQGAFVDGSTVTFDFTAGAVNTLRIYPYTTGNPDTIKVDNISVRELYPFEQYRPDQGTMVVAFDTQSTGFRGPWWFSRGGANATGWGLRLNSTTTIDAMVRDSSNFNSLSNLTITPDFDIVAASYEQRASDTFCSVATATNFDDDGHVNNVDVSVDTLDIGQCQIGGSNTGISSGHIKRLRYFPVAMNDSTKLKNMCDD